MALNQSLKAINKEDKAKVGKKDLFTADPRLLTEAEGFNARGAFEQNYFERADVRTHIDGFKESYRDGRYVPPIVVKVIDGTIYVRDGHCRTRALKELIDEGLEIQKVNVEPLQGDETEQLSLIVTSNDGLPLTQLERASVYARLGAYGLSDTEIAKKVNRTPGHVGQLKQMLDMPWALKRMVQEGTVAAHYALELFREHGTAAVDVVEQAKKENQSHSGGQDGQDGQGDDQQDQTKSPAKKVTRRSVEKKRRLSKKVVDSMHHTVSSLTRRLDAVEQIDDNRYRLEISRDEYDEIQALREKLAEFEAEASGGEAEQEGYE